MLGQSVAMNPMHPVGPLMELVLTRTVLAPSFTLGTLSGPLREALHVLEDADRHLEDRPEDKVRGRSAIPTGRYRLELYNSPRHGPDTIQLVAVPGFGHVQVHAGNTPDDTLGCLLVGMEADAKVGRVNRSREALASLKGTLVPPLRLGTTVELIIRRAAAA